MSTSDRDIKWKFEDPDSGQNTKLSSAWQAMSHLELRNLLGMLLRQWRLIASILGLILLLALAALSQLSYRYTAEALLTIDERESQLVGQSDSSASSGTLNNRVDSEVEILGSTSVALGVIDRLALWRDAEFGFSGLSRTDKLKALVGIDPPTNNLASIVRLTELPADQQATLVTKLQNAIRIERRGLTSVISIKATSKDKTKSALFANAVADSYLEVQINAKSKTAQSAVDFLAKRVDELAKNLQEVNSKTENFILTQTDSVGTPEARAEMMRIRDQITNVSAAQANFSATLNQLKTLANDPNSISPESVPAELRAIAEQRAAAAKKILSEASDPDLQNQLRTLDQKLIDMATVRVSDLQSQLAAQDKQKGDLRKQLQDIFSSQQIPNEVAVNLYRLQREAESSRKLYESFSSRLGEVQQQVGLALPNSRIVAPAIIPGAPSFPPSQLIMMLATLVGLGLGVAAAIARESLVGGFALPAQAEAITGVPVIATVPRDASSTPQTTLVDDPLSSFSESLRRMRIGVEEAVAHTPTKVILVTSTEPGEGKSTLAMSLGRALAAVGRSVVLVDCDFRHPSVGKLSGLSSPADLVEVLKTFKIGQSVEGMSICDASSQLELITTSAAKKQASDVIVSAPSFSQFVDALRMKYEYVILDSPPIGYVVDARILNSLADLLLYVVKQNSTSQQDAVSGLRQVLGTKNLENAGLILNSVQNTLGGYYYGKSRYSYYYKEQG
jgi:polysaccharide biosynthesis transport protein